MKILIGQFGNFLCCVITKTILVSRPIIQAKAKDISNDLAISELNAGNRWLEFIKSRHSINFHILFGESPQKVLKVQKNELQNCEKLST